MKLCWVTLQVRNLEKSMNFYHTLLGLAVSSRFSAGPSVDIVMLGDDDQPKLELLCNRNAPPQVAGNNITIGFPVVSLDETLAFLRERRLEISKEPFSPKPGLRFAFVKDPDGYEVQLVEEHN